MFLLLTDGRSATLVSLRRAPTWRLHTMAGTYPEQRRAIEPASIQEFWSMGWYTSKAKSGEWKRKARNAFLVVFSQPLYFHFALAVNSVNTNQNWNFVAEISFEEKAREGWLRKLLVLRRFWLYIDVCILRIQKRSRYIWRELVLLVVLARIDLKKKKLAQLLLQTVA